MTRQARTADPELDREPGSRHPADQRIKLAEARLRQERRGAVLGARPRTGGRGFPAVGGGAEQAEQVTQLCHRITACRLDGEQRGFRVGRGRRQDLPRRASLDDHDGHIVRDDVVQLGRDAGTLGGKGPFRRRRGLGGGAAQPGRGVGEPPAKLADAETGRSSRQDHESR